MATRYKTYELTPNVFGTYDSQTEAMPTEYIAGPFDVNIEEAEIIKDGGNIEIIDNQAVITAPVLEGEVI